MVMLCKQLDLLESCFYRFEGDFSDMEKRIEEWEEEMGVGQNPEWVKQLNVK
jgi:hypothetical protein